MATLRFLGGARVVVDQDEECTALGRKARELLALLLTNSAMPRSREQLANILWPERIERQARSSLSTELSKLRAVLTSSGTASRTKVQSAADGTVSLLPGADLHVDARALDDAVAEALAARDENGEMPRQVHDRLEAALADYRGPYLDGYTADWILIERERLHAVHARGLSLMIAHQAHRGDYAEAIALARRALAEDPQHERTHRELIGLLAADGQRCEAMAQYRRLEAMLAEELGVEPMPETRAVMERIIKPPDS